MMKFLRLVALILLLVSCLTFDKKFVNAEEEEEEEEEEQNQGSGNMTKPPEEAAGLFEGDIKLDKVLEESLFPDGPTNRDAILSITRQCPGGVVPYVIEWALNQTPQKQKIYEAINQFNIHTCIRFIPHTTESHYLKFIRDNGCYSYIGRTKIQQGYQELSLGTGCHLLGIVIHEMMHALGFFHEQTRLDRDDYVTIVWDNIQTGRKHNFKKYSHGQADLLNTKYDYASVMHYSAYAFRKYSSQKTIITKNSSAVIGQRIGFSKTDIRQINILYKCDKPGCRDNSTQCSTYKSNGYCSSSSSHYTLMKTLCPYTCDLCSLYENCTDKSVRCYHYHSKGYCASHEVVRKHCPLTCGECEISKCADKRERSCPHFKSNGYCNTTSHFYPKMVEFCPLTCGLCV